MAISTKVASLRQKLTSGLGSNNYQIITDAKNIYYKDPNSNNQYYNLDDIITNYFRMLNEGSFITYKDKDITLSNDQINKQHGIIINYDKE